MFLQKHCQEGEEPEKVQGSCMKQLSYDFHSHLSVWTLAQTGYVGKSLPTCMEAQEENTIQRGGMQLQEWDRTLNVVAVTSAQGGCSSVT